MSTPLKIWAMKWDYPHSKVHGKMEWSDKPLRNFSVQDRTYNGFWDILGTKVYLEQKVKGYIREDIVLALVDQLEDAIHLLDMEGYSCKTHCEVLSRTKEILDR